MRPESPDSTSPSPAAKSIRTRYSIISGHSGAEMVEKVEVFLQRYPRWRVINSSPMFNEFGTFAKHITYLTCDDPENISGPTEGEKFTR